MILLPGYALTLRCLDAATRYPLATLPVPLRTDLPGCAAHSARAAHHHTVRGRAWHRLLATPPHHLGTAITPTLPGSLLPAPVRIHRLRVSGLWVRFWHCALPFFSPAQFYLDRWTRVNVTGRFVVCGVSMDHSCTFVYYATDVLRHGLRSLLQPP